MTSGFNFGSSNIPSSFSSQSISGQNQFQFGSPQPGQANQQQQQQSQQPSPSPFSLSTPGSSNIFGAAATPGQGFGFGASPSVSSFGSSTVPAPTSGFGSPSLNVSSFGSSVPGPQQNQQNQQTSLFGSVPNLFSSNISSASSGQPSMISGNNQVATFGGVAAGQAAVKSPENSIMEIAAAYNPNSPSCRFRHMFYNVVPPDQVKSYVKPANVSEVLWQQAVNSNPCPSRLVPCQATGFLDLRLRIIEQQKTTELHSRHIAEIEKLISQFQQKHLLNTIVKINTFRQTHVDLCHRVLKVVNQIEILQKRGYPIHKQEEILHSKLRNLQELLKKPSVFKGKLSELSSLVRMQEDAGPAPPHESIDPSTLSDVHKYLAHQQKGLAHLKEIIETDLDDLKTMNRVMEKARSPGHYQK